MEKWIKPRDIFLNSVIIRPRTKFRSLPEHFSSILCMRVRSQERTIFRAPPNRLSDSFRLRLLSNVRYTHRRSRIAADFYIFSDYCCAAFCRCPSDYIFNGAPI